MPCCTIVARLPAPPFASRQVPCVPSWIAFRTIVKALQKELCGAKQIAYYTTDIGSADNLVEQGLDLRNTANKTLPGCYQDGRVSNY
jgi:hypothetical protein